MFATAGEGLELAYSLAETVVSAFEGTTTERGVEFRNTRLNEIGPDGDWFQINVLADFTYDEVK